MFNWFNLFSPKYKVGDFILTKPFIDKKGNSKGNIVLRIEHILEDNFLCSKGRFEIKFNPKRLEWVFDKSQKLTQISKDNVNKVLSTNQAYKALNERVKK